ncbi:hypothetical protein QZH41_004482 [Actinostola sp. cb2023]|nr:hypothetical protein QZH41_004482 [Actinostola sp. cb2023]
MDWSKCLFCGNKTYKKSKEMNNVSTFEACNTIKTVAEATDDHRILHILRGVNNDLVAAEAKYHKSCFASYTSKSNLKHKTFKETHDESLYSLAFKELASSIESGIDEGKAYDMSSLLSMYQNSLQSKGQRLKLRLQNHFAERIVFHQPFDKRKPELVYSSKISLQDVINAAVDLHPSKQQGSSSNESSSDKTNYIFEAAKMIKNDIKQCNGICTRPLSDVNDLNQETVRRIVPNRLYWLLRWIIGCDVEDASTNAADERRILSIAQDIIHCSSNARVKTPKHIGLAMSVHHSTGSKQIVTLLNSMGYCSSYDELKSVDTSLASEVLAKSEEYGTVLPSNISLGSFVQIAADNNDFNEETLDENVKELECQVQQVVSVFNEFKEEARAKSKLFAFWEEYGTMVDILLQFIKAERTGDWNLHLAATANMLPYFFAMDRQNYARWMPVYLAEMNQLHDKHPEVHQQFVDGNHAVSRSDNQPFSQVWTDMALEQSINADSKSIGGIVGITQSQSALDRWFSFDSS